MRIKLYGTGRPCQRCACALWLSVRTPVSHLLLRSTQSTSLLSRVTSRYTSHESRVRTVTDSCQLRTYLLSHHVQSTFPPGPRRPPRFQYSEADPDMRSRTLSVVACAHATRHGGRLQGAGGIAPRVGKVLSAKRRGERRNGRCAGNAHCVVI